MILLAFCYWSKVTWRRMGLFQLTAYSLPSREVNMGTQGRNLEGGAKAKTTEWLYLVACLAWLDQFALLYTQDHLPWGTTDSRMGSCSLTWVHRFFTDRPTGQSDGGGGRDRRTTNTFENAVMNSSILYAD